MPRGNSISIGVHSRLMGADLEAFAPGAATPSR